LPWYREYFFGRRQKCFFLISIKKLGGHKLIIYVNVSWPLLFPRKKKERERKRLARFLA
jgi:hypothetical protein